MQRWQCSIHNGTLKPIVWTDVEDAVVFIGLEVLILIIHICFLAIKMSKSLKQRNPQIKVICVFKIINNGILFIYIYIQALQSLNIQSCAVSAYYPILNDNFFRTQVKTFKYVYLWYLGSLLFWLLKCEMVLTRYFYFH